MTLFLANPDSFHLATWKEIYRRLGRTNIQLATIHDVESTINSFNRATKVSIRPKFLAYAVLGLKLRALRQPWVHAHGASGYGLAAFVSGKPYIATVYGSEVLAPHSRLYRAMMATILRHARAITVTSKTTRDVVIKDFCVPSQRVHWFHTGIDTDALDALSAPEATNIPKDRKIVFSMRNAAPTYRTADIIQACAELIDHGHSIELVVPLGNGDQSYFRDLQSKYPFSWIHYLNRRLENKEMLNWMQRADVCVSYPSTDQMSTTILEALYLAPAVVVGWLDAYSELAQALGENANIYFAQAGGLADSLAIALDYHNERSGSKLVRERYSIEQAVLHQRKVLETLND